MNEINTKEVIQELMGHKIPEISNSCKRVKEISELYNNGKITESQYKELVNDVLDLNKVDKSSNTLENKILIKQAFTIILEILSKTPFL